MARTIEMKPTKELKELGKTLHSFIDDAANEALADSGRKIQKYSEEEVPVFNGTLLESITLDMKDLKPLKIVEVYSIIEYADSVHEGGIPHGAFSETQRKQLRLWTRRKGLEKYLQPILYTLHDKGIQNPTPFFDNALKRFTQRDMNKIWDGAVKRIINNPKYRGILYRKT